MREKTERQIGYYLLWAALGVVYFFWPLVIDQHSNGSPSVAGWVVFGVWVLPALALLAAVRHWRGKS